ncbi:hypothetical protein F7725_025417 [Dissostichus mawsoni]|uniref:Uncharacterized protein n=1 Tax=Dissostichus mawsoni TaxID=36200 RepID=A0A7J5XBJ0_DISMA|nr:hypothetical protein F7725_025417 [Dissostichus mawsoni]
MRRRWRKKKKVEEEDDDEEDESSDTDIEEEIQASTQQAGDDDEEDGNEAEPACDAADKEDQTDQLAGSVTRDEEGNAKEDDEEPVTSGLSPLSEDSCSHFSPLSDLPSPRQSPSQSEPMKTEEKTPLSNGVPSALEEPADSSNHVSVLPVSTSKDTKDAADACAAAANRVTVPLSPVVIVGNCNTQTNGTSPPPSIRARRSQKRKREERISGNSRNSKHILIHDSDVDIPLDMTCSSPQRAELTRASTPTREIVSSSQYTPPPKKNKVNVATQCDPDEVIILSDSE